MIRMHTSVLKHTVIFLNTMVRNDTNVHRNTNVLKHIMVFLNTMARNDTMIHRNTMTVKNIKVFNLPCVIPSKIDPFSMG